MQLARVAARTDRGVQLHRGVRQLIAHYWLDARYTPRVLHFSAFHLYKLVLHLSSSRSTKFWLVSLSLMVNYAGTIEVSCARAFLLQLLGSGLSLGQCKNVLRESCTTSWLQLFMIDCAAQQVDNHFEKQT